jgi:ketosteroid isomerase-like protein
VGDIKMEAKEEVKNEILSILDDYAKYYLNKDLDGLISLFVSDQDLVAIGTGADEWVNGLDQLRNGFIRDLSQADDIRMIFDNLTISKLEEVVWVSGTMTMHAMVDGSEVIMPGRITMVLIKRNNGWLFTHLHYSVPAEKQENGESWPE